MTTSAVKSIEQQIKNQVDKRRNVVDGKVAQAKGKAQEKLGELTHNDRMRRAGRRQQLRGKLRERAGWLTSSKTWLLLGTAVALIVAFILRRNGSASQANA